MATVTILHGSTARAVESVAKDFRNMANQYHKGRYVLAESLGREILLKDPTNLKVHYMMGSIYYNLKDLPSALAQYKYCLQAGRNQPMEKIAAAAVTATIAKQREVAEQVKAQENSKENSGEKTTDSPQNSDKPNNAADLKRCAEILEKAQQSLLFKKRETDTIISHVEEFARSRISEIPVQIMQRRMSAFNNIEASRINESYIATANYDRPAEVARIRSSESEKVGQYIDAFKKQQKKIVDDSLQAVELIIGRSREIDQSSINLASKPPPLTPLTPVNIGAAYTACGITTHKYADCTKVIAVQSGSVAHRAGLMPNDEIKQSTFIPAADLLTLLIARNENHYTLKMHPNPAKNEAFSSVVKASPKTDSKTSKSQLAWQRIKDSEIVFMEEMSDSMRIGLGDSGIARWDWAAARIANFADALSTPTPRNFTVTECFQSEQTFKELSAAGLRQLLASSIPHSRSNLTNALINAANDHIESRSSKPLLIMVFTTGHPELGESMETAIKNISDRVKNADSIRIVFFQIGDDTQGTAMLQMLDDDMVYAGLKYDIVDFVSFEELQSAGLSKALLDAYERPRASGSTAPLEVTDALLKRLEDVRKQLAASKTKQ